jgi:hypothetical protein
MNNNKNFVDRKVEIEESMFSEEDSSKNLRVLFERAFLGPRNQRKPWNVPRRLRNGKKNIEKRRETDKRNPGLVGNWKYVQQNPKMIFKQKFKGISCSRKNIMWKVSI